MKHVKNLNNISGLTMVEVIVASIISTIVIIMIYAIYSSGSDLWETKRTQAHIQAQGRFAMSEMVSELRRTTRTSSVIPSPNIVIPAVPNNTVIDFYLPADLDSDGYITDSVTGAIEWNSTAYIEYLFNSTENTLTRSEIDANTLAILSTKNLAHDVSSVQFSDMNIDGQLLINEVKIIMTLNKLTPRQRNITMNFSSIARLRN